MKAKGTKRSTERPIDSLCQRLAQVIPDHWIESALRCPSTELEDRIKKTVSEFRDRVWETITPIPAKNTRFVGRGWRILSDDPGPNIDPANLDPSYCPISEDEFSITGAQLLRRAAKIDAIGGLGFAERVIEYQTGRHGHNKRLILPARSADVRILLPRTVVEDNIGRRRIGCLQYSEQHRQWYVTLIGVSRNFNKSFVLLRLRDNKEKD